MIGKSSLRYGAHSCRPSIDSSGAVAHDTFTEATLADVVASMGAIDEAALAEFELDLDFRHAGGRLTRVDLRARLTIDMPAWPGSSSRPQPEQDEWAPFLRALRHHLDGHVTIFRREASTNHQLLRGAKPDTINAPCHAEGPTCHLAFGFVGSCAPSTA